jgi:hypothetical protein
MAETKERSITEIPEDLIRSATEHLWQYTVGFVGVESKNKVQSATLLGSGVPVNVNGKHAFLTAAHVIDVLPRSGRLGLVLSATAEQTTIDISGISYLKIARGDKPEAGPDIAAVMLSSSVASAVASKKTFYNLASRKEQMLNAPPQDREGIWVASGFVEELTQIDPNPAPYETLKAFCHFGTVGGVDSYRVDKPHDYFVFPVSHPPNSSVPHNFGGVSGSGLWHVLLREDKAGVLAVYQYILQGLTYYQDPYVDGKSALRCHGARSIYSVAYEAICRDEL